MMRRDGELMHATETRAILFSVSECQLVIEKVQ
jgi:hypothetical protein